MTDQTEFDDDGGLSTLEAVDRVEVEYEFQDETHVALGVEQEDGSSRPC